MSTYDSADKSAVFALGGNTEIDLPWNDDYNRLRRSGRWFITLTDPSDRTSWNVGYEALPRRRHCLIIRDGPITLTSTMESRGPTPAFT